MGEIMLFSYYPFKITDQCHNYYLEVKLIWQSETLPSCVCVCVECKAPLLVCSTTAQLLDESCANLPGVAGCHGGYSHGAGSSRGLQSTRPLTMVHTLQLHKNIHTYYL